jgi:hypothetical protein
VPLSYRPLGGQLPFGSTPAPVAGGSPGQVQSSYNQAYGNALRTNQQNYQNVLGGFQQTAADQSTAQDALQRGYQELSGFIGSRAQADQDDLIGRYGRLGERAQDRLAGMDTALAWSQGDAAGRTGWFNDLNRDVLGDLAPMRAAADRFRGQNEATARGHRDLSRGVMDTISGIGRSELMDIEERYARARGSTDQSLISRGLGNATVRDAMQRGNLFDRTRAGIDLSDRLAATRAGYQSQLGLAGLGFGERSAGAELGQENLVARTRADARQSLGQFGLAQSERQSERTRDQQNLTAQARAGLEADVGRAGLSAYGNSMADSRAQQAALGQARLGFGERAVGNNTALNLRQLGFMEGVQAPYPDPSAYAQLAAMSGAGGRGGADAFGGSGGGAGGMTTTRGGPWTGDRLRPGPGGGDPFTAMIARGGAALGGRTDAFGNAGGGGGVAFPDAARVGFAPLSQSPYAPPETGFGGGVTGGAPAYPDQLDAGGGTAGGGLTPGDPASQGPYPIQPGPGFGGGYGQQVDPQALAPAGGLAPTQGNPFAPQAGGFGGGVPGGAVLPPIDWEFMVPVE